MRNYLVREFGEEKYQEHVNENHFVIHSAQHLKESQKDLAHVGYDTDHTILIDNIAENAAEGQKTMIIACSNYCMEKIYQNITEKTELSETELSEKDGALYFALNHAFYFVGMIQNALEKMKTNDELTLRKALKKTLLLGVLSTEKAWEFVHTMHKKGLSEIQTINKNAKLVTQLAPEEKIHLLHPQPKKSLIIGFDLMN